MKLVVECKEFEIDDKRFYMPGTRLVGNCPKCNASFEKDFGEEYLSYPKANAPMLVHLWCQECNHEWTVTTKLEVKLELVPMEKTDG